MLCDDGQLLLQPQSILSLVMRYDVSVGLFGLSVETGRTANLYGVFFERLMHSFSLKIEQVKQWQMLQSRAYTSFFSDFLFSFLKVTDLQTGHLFHLRL